MAEERFFEKERGILIVISGPSSAGKGTVCRIVRAENPDIALSVSETTRGPRPGEVDGVDYFFTTKEKFAKRIAQGKYLEHATVYENFYGTPKDRVEELMDAGHDVILEIDIQGAAQVRRNYKEGIYIFIAPPSMEELRRRLECRGTESPEQMALRLACAHEEMSNTDDYSYIVINEDKDVAAGQVQAIITAEKCRSERLKNKVHEILGR